MTAAAPFDPIEILLVEDNPADIRLTQEAFRGSRFPNAIRVARDGIEALAMLRECRLLPDLLFLDLNLPRMNGRELLDEIRSDDRLRAIPVIVLTTSTSPEDVAYAYEHGANSYLPKPVDLNEFLCIVRAIEDFWMAVATLPKARRSPGKEALI